MRKLRKITIVLVITLVVALSTVSAAVHCPNCSSDNTTYYGTDVFVVDTNDCSIDPYNCTVETLKWYYDYGCNSCLYNWGEYWKTTYSHSMQH